MTTEVVVFSLKPDAAFSKVFSEKMAPTLHAHGAQNLLWGEAIGDPLMATMLADWKSLDDHKKFTESRYVALQIRRAFLLTRILFNTVILVLTCRLVWALATLTSASLFCTWITYLRLWYQQQRSIRMSKRRRCRCIVSHRRLERKLPRTSRNDSVGIQSITDGHTSASHCLARQNHTQFSPLSRDWMRTRARQRG